MMRFDLKKLSICKALIERTSGNILDDEFKRGNTKTGALSLMSVIVIRTCVLEFSDFSNCWVGRSLAITESTYVDFTSLSKFRTA